MLLRITCYYSLLIGTDDMSTFQLVPLAKSLIRHLKILVDVIALIGGFCGRMILIVRYLRTSDGRDDKIKCLTKTVISEK